MTIDELKNVDLESILDMNLEDIPEAADFVTPPVGFYRLGITKCEQKEMGENEGISVSFTVLETLETNKKDVTRVPDGSLFSVGYSGAFGLSNLKKQYKEVSEAGNYVTFRELIENLEGMEVFAIVKNRKDKNDPEKVYASVESVKPV